MRGILQRLFKRQGRRYRTPTLLHMEAVECGAAALGIILGYYGRFVPLAELRQVCGVSRNGVSAFNIMQAARTYQLNARSFKTDLAALRQLTGPCIVFWNFNHFLVVEGFSHRRVYLNDPATGPRSVSWEEFSGSYTGVLLLLEPGQEFKPGGQKQSVLKGLGSRLSGSVGALVYALIAGFLLVIPGLAVPVSAQIFVDDILIQGKDEWLRPLIVGIIFAALLNGWLTLLQLQFLRRMKIKLAVGMTSRFMWHILRLPISFYEQRFAGEISSRVQLNNSIANLLSGKLATTATAAVAIMIYALVMLQYDLVLTAIALGFVLMNLAVLQWIRRQRVDANIKLIQAYGKVSGVAISGLQSIETLKASGLESEFFSQWVGYYASAINARQELETSNQILAVLPTLLSGITQILILTVGGWRVMNGEISIGMLVAFQGMMQRFLAPVNSLVSLGSELQEMEGNLNRLDDVLANPVDPQVEQELRTCPPDPPILGGERLSSPQSWGARGAITSAHPLVRLQGRVELRHVTFGYSRVESPLIEDFNLQLQPGQRVALVGASGSGKSTIAKLVCGLYEPWSGEILFDGLPRNQLNRSVLANSIATVEQEIVLFSGSVRDNLTLWDMTVPNSALVRACSDAALHKVILSLPGGYNAELNEGATNLSGGQRQRLEIARALVNNPTILVMDEATSALDAETEKIVAHNLRLRGCSCIIVAHRLSTIRDCDLILVLQEGKVVQQGTHLELSRIEGVYKQLLRSEAETINLPAGMGTDEVWKNGARQLSPEDSAGHHFHVSDAEIERLNRKQIKIPGQYHCLTSNESLLLDQEQTIWVVKSGNLALFASPRTDGVISGSRHYLFSTKPGQAIFATPPLQASKQHRLEALAIEETELLKLSVADFSQFLAQVKEEAIALIEGWIQQLGTVVTDISPATLPPLSEPIRFFSLIQDQIFQPQQPVSWVQLETGRARWMGREQLLLTPASGVLPLAASMWLLAEETVELKCFQTAELQTVAAILNGLAQLHIYALDRIEQLQQRELETELLRFQAQAGLDRQLMQQTLGKLASVLPAPASSRPGHGSGFETIDSTASDQALLVAAGAIGHSLGIKIRSPDQSFDPKHAQDPLEAIARASHIRIRQIKLQPDWWHQDCGPMLAYTQQDKHPVVLLPVSGTGYELFEPVRSSRIPVDASTAASLASTAYIFYRPLPEKLSPLNLLAFALREHTREILVILLTGIAVSLLGMLTPQATAILIDQAIPDADRGLLLQIAFGLAAAVFGGMLFQLAQGFAIIRLETFADSSTQTAVWDRLLNLKAGFFRRYSVGDLNSRVSAISQIRRRIGSTVLRTIFSSLFSLLNLGLLFYYSPKLALVASGVALVNIAITVTSGVLTVQKTRPLLEREGQIAGVMVQLINSVAKLRIAKAEARAFAFWGQQYAEQLKLTLSTQGIEDVVAVMNQILPALTMAALFWVAAGLIGQATSAPVEPGLSTGTFLAFNAAFGTFISAATSLSITVVEVLQVLPLWKRAEPIVLAPPEINFTQADPGPLIGRLAVERLTFSYSDTGPLILDDISIHAQAGEFIAIVGPSGSGKSTLLRLLLGFEFSQSGNVYYDGQDLAQLDLHAVRRQLGVVMQNSRLMSASIFQNIASSALITMDEAWEAAQIAGLADDIAAMPMRMHTIVSEGGSNLSGGQRQRLLIARALVLKPRILLFDEATSALDNRTQAVVSQNLEQLQVTRVVIAHRLSTIRHANRIYVLQAGKVVQHGSFPQLAHQPGLFAQLIRRQLL